MRRRRISWFFAAIIMLVLVTGSDWLRLGWQAWGYPAAAPDARSQVVFAGNQAYVAAGNAGIEVRTLARSAHVTLVGTPTEVDRIDDLAYADGLLFALDATPPGHLLVYSLSDPRQPRLVGTPMLVEVGPFSGVSAAAGVVAVSGGTSRLSLRHYDRLGVLGKYVVLADYGRGQPDVALREDGRYAAVSTHLYGPRFALTLVRIQHTPLTLTRVGELAISRSGFTAGGFKPAHFPLVARWAGSRLYVAHGGGLDVVTIEDGGTPRLLVHLADAAPAMDLALAGDQLFVLRAGAKPEVLQYRLDGAGRPQLPTSQSWPLGRQPASLAVQGQQLFLIDQQSGWQTLTSAAFVAGAPRNKQRSNGDNR